MQILSTILDRHLGSTAFAGLILLCLLWTATCTKAMAGDSQIMPLAEQSLLLDGQVIGDKIVVVGERGHILLSEDHGRSWHQQQVPTRATLTSVFFIDPDTGWAAGHDSIILRTDDGGHHWQEVYSDAGDERPILDLWFGDSAHGYAVGAYGLFLETGDGGKNWQPVDFFPATVLDDEAPAEEAQEESWGIDFHLNQITATASGRLFIAAEAGNLYRSDDGGRSWLSLPSPYEGSFYGVLPLAQGEVIAFGLRGHLFHSNDAGNHWAELDAGSQATLNDGIHLQGGQIVLAGQAGTLLFSSGNDLSFALRAQPDRAAIAKILQTGEGDLILIGEHGVKRLDLSKERQEAGP